VRPAPVTLIIPCLNEAAGLPVLLKRLSAENSTREVPWDLLFIDDGSTDDTFRLLTDAAASGALRVVRHESNRGLGAALRTGFENTQAPIVVATDSDLTCPLETLPLLVSQVEEGADIAIGSPWHPLSGSSECSYFRTLMSRGASVLYRIVLGRKLYSWTCMCRAYRRTSLQRLRFDSNGFVAVTEILVQAALRRYDIREVPMPLGVRKLGESKMHTARAVRSHLKLLALAQLVRLGLRRGSGDR
jgi:dolichol-phosphate mannosyltransferase